MFEVNGIVYANNMADCIKISDAHITGDKMMLLTFSTGEKRVFDATELVGIVFEPLNDPDVFENFHISHGVITWLDESIDCAPEYMYQHSYAYDTTFALANAEEDTPNRR
jgi:hypothetical protein